MPNAFAAYGSRKKFVTTCLGGSGIGAMAILLAIGLLGCGSEPESVSCEPTSVSYEPTSVSYHNNFHRKQCCLVIAHAGGGVDGNAYTNSAEALARNYAMGTRIFEIDFEKTSDGHWVAVHDWAHWQRLTRFDGVLPPSVEEFRGQPLAPLASGMGVRREYTPVTLDDIRALLHGHPAARIVTDTKNQELVDLVQAIRDGQGANQFIIQAYSAADVVRISGIDRRIPIILTKYKMGRMTVDQFREIVENHRDRLVGVTVPLVYLHEPGAFESLRRTRVPILVHGAPSEINSRELHYSLGLQGVAGFYLD
jgi:glycerophosphoryl diester phosphodiesterase